MELLIIIILMGVSGLIGAFIGATVKRTISGFWLGFFFSGIGWIIVLLLPRNETTLKSTPNNPLTKRPKPNLNNDDYKLWLGKTYNIQKNYFIGIKKILRASKRLGFL